MSEQRSRTWDIVMITLLLGSIAVAFWYEGVDPVEHAALRSTLEWLDLALVTFFVLEWLWRARSTPGSAGRYAVRNSWELLGMIPLMAPLPSFLRTLRFLRVVRILRVFGVVGKSLGFWQRVASQDNLKKVGLASVVITLGGAALVWALERDSNPDLVKFNEALWWAVVTVTTVGYGDITPETTMGRFVAVLLMVTGIGIIGTLASTMARVLLDDQRDELAEDAMRQDAPDTIAGQLTALATLHESGKLSDEEYQTAKARVLSRV